MHGWIVFLGLLGGVSAILLYVNKYGPTSKGDPHDNDDPTSFWE